MHRFVARRTSQHAKGTFLSGFNVKATGKGTYIVGTANTNETFNGVIDNRAQGGQQGTTNIEKQGSGVWRLTGANVYSGTTYITAGTLVVNGKHTGTGAVTVRKGATLGGKGTLAAATTINKGGILQVGDTLATDNGLQAWHAPAPARGRTQGTATTTDVRNHPGLQRHCD